METAKDYYIAPEDADYVRVFPDGLGNYMIDAAITDDDGDERYTEVCWDSYWETDEDGEREWWYLDSIEIAMSRVPAFIDEVVPHLKGTKPKVRL